VTIIANEYRKDVHHKPGHGYGWEPRPDVWVAERPSAISSAIVHTTSNPRKGTTFRAECEFIRDSPLVSCHEVIGKRGEVAIILPDSAQAWHAGTVRAEFYNAVSLGWELHVSQGEAPTPAQIATLTERITERIAKYGLRKEHIETHRAVALPRGRKQDPEGWNDLGFYHWRDGLFDPEWHKEWYWSNYDQVKDWGIPTRWREEHQAGRPLGKPLYASERTRIDGRQDMSFELGYITWRDGEGTRVYRESK
jgi:hypothetical protein